MPLVLFVAALIAGCAGAPRQPSQAEPATIASEERRLRDVLAGTPVETSIAPDGRLRIQVPLEFSFDAGRSAVKKPLAAVLDRVAVGLLTAPFEIAIAAPADREQGGNLLAQDRAASVRDYLIARGVTAWRFGALSRARGAFVELLVAEKVRRTAGR